MEKVTFVATVLLFVQIPAIEGNLFTLGLRYTVEWSEWGSNKRLYKSGCELILDRFLTMGNCCLGSANEKVKGNNVVENQSPKPQSQEECVVSKNDEQPISNR